MREKKSREQFLRYQLHKPVKREVMDLLIRINVKSVTDIVCAYTFDCKLKVTNRSVSEDRQFQRKIERKYSYRQREMHVSHLLPTK